MLSHLIKEIMFIVNLYLFQIGPLSSPTFYEIPFLGGNCLCAGNISGMFLYLEIDLRIFTAATRVSIMGGAVAGPIRGQISLGLLHVAAPFQQRHHDREIQTWGDVTALVRISFCSLAARAIPRKALSRVHTARLWVELPGDCKIVPMHLRNDSHSSAP